MPVTTPKFSEPYWLHELRCSHVFIGATAKSTVSHVETQPTEFANSWRTNPPPTCRLNSFKQNPCFYFFLGLGSCMIMPITSPSKKYMFFATKRKHIFWIYPSPRDAFISTTVWRLTFLSNREYIYSLYRLICHPDGPGWLETLEELERIVFEWILEEGQSQGTPVGGSEIWNVPSDVARKGSLYYGLYYYCIWQTYLLLHSINSTWLTLVKYWKIHPWLPDIADVMDVVVLETFYRITPWFVGLSSLITGNTVTPTKTSHPTWPSPPDPRFFSIGCRSWMVFYT